MIQHVKDALTRAGSGRSIRRKKMLVKAYCHATTCKYNKDRECNRGNAFVNIDADARCEDYEEDEEDETELLHG